MKKQEMVKVLKDPEQTELFENPNLARIVSILRRGELNIKEVHKFFNENYEDKKTLTSMYRYMEKLVESGLVFVSREELKRGHLIERYYSRTAKIFAFEEERAEENVANAASELVQLVYNLDPETAEKLKESFRQWARNMHHHKVDFYEKYGEVIINLERKYGFKPVLHAADAINEFLYFKRNPELAKRIFEILGNSA